MDNLQTLTLTKEEALPKWRAAIRAEHQAQDREQKRQRRQEREVYLALKDGAKLLDLFLTVRNLPMNADGEPAIAVAPVGAKWGYFHKSHGQVNGEWFRGGMFNESSYPYGTAAFKSHIRIPGSTWSGNWPCVERNANRIVRPTLRSLAPPIPQEHAPADPTNRFVLWGVEHWDAEPPPDPLLLHRLTNNLFIIEKEWDLGPVEQAIIRGMLA